MLITAYNQKFEQIESCKNFAVSISNFRPKLLPGLLDLVKMNLNQSRWINNVYLSDFSKKNSQQRALKISKRSFLSVFTGLYRIRRGFLL